MELLVDPAVTKDKLDREVGLWHENAEIYRKRGWVLLERVDTRVDVGFLAHLPFGGVNVPVMAACVRLDFSNYDLVPPSVEFIDPLSGEYVNPIIQAVVPSPEGPRDLLVGSHPSTNRPFFCVPGTREYHEHPQHTGDSWHLHRASKEGSLATICDRIWRAMPRTLLGVQVITSTLPPESGQNVEVQLRLLQGDIDVLRQSVGAVVPAELPGAMGPA